MDVVSVTDGKNFGKVCDLSFFFPENKLKGFFVTGCKGFRLGRSEVFVPVSDVVKIGEDVILIRTGERKKPPKDDCDRCPPPQQNFCPPPNGCCPPAGKRDDRRSFDEYE